MRPIFVYGSNPAWWPVLQALMQQGHPVQPLPAELPSATPEAPFTLLMSLADVGPWLPLLRAQHQLLLWDDGVTLLRQSLSPLPTAAQVWDWGETKPLWQPQLRLVSIGGDAAQWGEIQAWVQAAQQAGLLPFYAGPTGSGHWMALMHAWIMQAAQMALAHAMQNGLKTPDAGAENWSQHMADFMQACAPLQAELMEASQEWWRHLNQQFAPPTANAAAHPLQAWQGLQQSQQEMWQMLAQHFGHTAKAAEPASAQQAQAESQPADPSAPGQAASPTRAAKRKPRSSSSSGSGN